MQRRSDATYPSLYQINTRVWLTSLSRSLGRPATLDDIPDAALDEGTERDLTSSPANDARVPRAP